MVRSEVTNFSGQIFYIALLTDFGYVSLDILYTYEEDSGVSAESKC